jgi:hypothetical protein
LEAARGGAAPGGAQLLLVGVEADRAATPGGGATPAQRAALTPAREAGPPRPGGRRAVARRAPDRAGLPVDLEVVDGEPCGCQKVGRRR